MAMVLVAMRRVWPSAGARATSPAPRLPAAPGLFSTITGWLHCAERLGWIIRTMMSLPPPGGYGTTILTVFVGNVSAVAEVAMKPSRRKSRFMPRSPS